MKRTNTPEALAVEAREATLDRIFTNRAKREADEAVARAARYREQYAPDLAAVLATSPLDRSARAVVAYREALTRADENAERIPAARAALVAFWSTATAPAPKPSASRLPRPARDPLALVDEPSPLPTPEALAAARDRAVDLYRENIDRDDLAARADEADDLATTAEATARDLADEYDRAVANSDRLADDLAARLDDLDLLAVEADEAEALARDLYERVREARETADKLRDRADDLAARLAALDLDLDRAVNGDDLVVTFTIATAADLAAARAVEKAKQTDDPDDRARADDLVEAAKKARDEAPRASFIAGAPFNPDRPALALVYGHDLADLVAHDLDLVVTKTAVDYNTPADPDLTLAAARAVARIAAKRSVERQGTPTQWAIRAAALAGNWDDPDLGDLVAEAAAALALVNAPEAVAAREAKRAEALAEAAATLAALDPADRRARAVYVNDLAARLDDPRLVADPRKLRARAEALDLALAARRARRDGDPITAASLATRAAYRALNNYLGDLRAIRKEATAPTLNLDDLADLIIDPRDLVGDPAALSTYEVRRRQIIRAALPEAVEALTPARRRALVALYRSGGNTLAAARRLGKDESTVREARAAIAAALARALVATAPDSIEATAFNLAAYTASIEATRAAADLAAARARAAAQKARRKARDLDLADLAAKTSEKTATVAGALAEAIKDLPAAQKATAELLARGTSRREAARRLGKDESTVREAAKGAARKIAAALVAVDPDLADEVNDLAARGDLAALVVVAARA